MKAPVRDPHTATRAAVPGLSVGTIDAAVARAEFAVLERANESVHKYYYIPIAMLPQHGSFELRRRRKAEQSHTEFTEPAEKGF